MFKFEQHKWYHIDAKGRRPCPRSGHAAVYYEGNMIVTGGTNDKL